MEILLSERREGKEKSSNSLHPHSLKVILHETIRNDDFKRNTA